MSPKQWRPGPTTAQRAAAWIAACLGLLLLLAAAMVLVWKAPPALYSYLPDPEDRASAEATTRTGIIAGLAGLAALGSVTVTARTYRLAQQGQLTDRYTKAIAQLGDTRLDVRLGGIYALERIAVDSRRDHHTIVEVLSAFVRERAAPIPALRPGALGRLSTDGQAALTVLGRLPDRHGTGRGDLSQANLCFADLEGANLCEADLRGANLSGADLTDARLSRADLRDARLTNASLVRADLANAHLSRAKLSDADLVRANLTRADLVGTELRGADLRGANLTGAELAHADLTNANLVLTRLSNANLRDADLADAKLAGTSLVETHGLATAQLASAYGSRATRLPGYLRAPDSWPREAPKGS